MINAKSLEIFMITASEHTVWETTKIRRRRKQVIWLLMPSNPEDVKVMKKKKMEGAKIGWDRQWG